MIGTRHLISLAALVALAFGLLLGACGDDDKNGAATPSAKETQQGVVGSFVGKVDGSDAFIGLSVADAGQAAKEREVMAYVCDGQQISQWFRGEASKDTVELTAANGARLQAKLGKERTSGTVTLADGRSLKFDAPRATGGAGLYRAPATINGVTHLGGWIVLPNGEQRGNINVGTNTTTAPRLDPTNPTLSVSGGTLQARLVNPFSSHLIFD